MVIFKLFIGPIDPILELKSALPEAIDLLAGKKKSRVMMTLLFIWKQGHPKCRYSHVVSSQPWYLEARQKRCTHIREAIFLKAELSLPRQTQTKLMPLWYKVTN